MYKKILVPMDGSEFGECSLAHVRAIANGCHVPEVILFGVVEHIPQSGLVNTYMGYDFIKKNDEEADKALKDYLSKIAEKLAKDGIKASISVVHGHAAQEILAFADKNGIDLIIMSTHGMSGIARWSMGSVAEKVIRTSAAPVLLAAPKVCRM
jgi:nucleotide-binding universal stress UspA family protein